MTSSCTIPTFDPTRPSRRNYFGFRRANMASSGVGLYHGLWWSYALDPADRRDPDTMGDAAICWVNGIRPPQPEKIDADGTTFS